MAICHFSSVDSGGGLLGHRIKLHLWQIIHLLPSVAAALCIPISNAWESVLCRCLKKNLVYSNRYVDVVVSSHYYFILHFPDD